MDASTSIEIAQTSINYTWDTMTGVLGTAGGVKFIVVVLLLLGVVGIIMRRLRITKHS